MSYTTNPHLPKVRRQAVLLVRQGWGIRKVARHLGFCHSTVSRWVARAPEDGRKTIPTMSSRPHTHPRSLDPKVVRAIIRTRLKYGRCAEVVHAHLVRHGIVVSLSSVKRTLDRQGLTKKRSPWKRLHTYEKRPEIACPGDLVQVDTVHLMATKSTRIYVYTLLDVYSRWAYARASERINAQLSVTFVRAAKRAAPFTFSHMQSDHGSEFSTHFSERLNLPHRHSRVRTPNDNGHLERFNRTLQEELIRRVPTDVVMLNKKLPAYLRYYNGERLHLGLDLKTPMEMVPRY